MLLNLHVKNLALVDEAEVEFGPGLNILSGETGAGKSILIGSINLALGARVPKELLRENAEYALVELIFGLEGEGQKIQLEELEIYPEDGQIILSRKITAGGRSVCRINSESVSASKMREAAALLIDIHGQHEHQSLLQKRRHLEILDEYAKGMLGNKKQELNREYGNYQSIQEEKRTALTDENQRLREQSFLEYEIKEIEAAHLAEGEDLQLEAEYRRMLNGKRILEAGDAAHGLTSGGMDGASELITRAMRGLVAVSQYDEGMQVLVQQLSDIDSLLNDFNRDLSTYLSDLEFSQEDFFRVEQRLDEINRLKGKYGDTIEAVLDQGTEKRNRYEKLKKYEQYLEDLKKRDQEAEGKLRLICEAVSGIRKKAAAKLTKQVKKALVDLNFLDVSFIMKFTGTDHMTGNGMDDAEFLISTNPGEPVKPLGLVASGGELSRIMLAIKTILAENDKIDTLIFDEIDTGISGRTAQMVAEKMNVIGKNHQVICITHLPQIAAMADIHFLIEKTVAGKAAISTIHRLDSENSILELARMLGGVKVTATVLKSAGEMKELALLVKKSQI